MHICQLNTSDAELWLYLGHVTIIDGLYNVYFQILHRMNGEPRHEVITNNDGHDKILCVNSCLLTETYRTYY